MASPTKHFGFSIVELVFALAIYGLIASMSIPKILTQSTNAKYKSILKSNLAMMSQNILEASMGAGASLVVGKRFSGLVPPNALFTNLNSTKYCGPVSHNTANTPFPACDMPVTPKKPTAAATQGWGGLFMMHDGSSVLWTVGCMTQAAAISCAENSSSALYIMIDADGGSQGPNTFGQDRIFVVYEPTGKFFLLSSLGISSGYGGTVDVDNAVLYNTLWK
jgi:type II secretory pathway pseudopilin PulG